jgi:AhpD family alkylhydroperoxidase
MSADITAIVTGFSRIFTDALGMLPHARALAEAIGFFGLEPRVRELAALAVARSGDCPGVVAVHRLIGRAAGLTDQELAGSLDGLTAAERAAVALALGTVSRARSTADGTPLQADAADEHFTPEQIRQLQAVALAVDLDCTVGRTARQLVGSVSGFLAHAPARDHAQRASD